MRLTIKSKIAFALWCAALISFGATTASAQVYNFNQTGQIRSIVSETAADAPSWKNTVHNAGFKFPNGANAKVHFYFAYSTPENGALNEKWLALPESEDWSQLANQTVRLRGNLKNNKLLNVAAAPLAALPESYLINPPPTTGRYKTVVVPLTIQTASVSGERGEKSAVLNVTPEAIRNNLFNLPNSVNNFYLEASYGKFGFTGVLHPQADVVAVTINATIAANCQEQIVTEFTPVVRQRLREQGIETANGSVDLGIIIFNDTPGCPPYPFATRGMLGQRGAPLWLWMPESWFATGPLIMAHEIGHALGGNHPFVLRCETFDQPQTCVAVDAADRDIMTSGGRFYQMPNNYERRRWGWHQPDAFLNPASGITQIFDLQSPAIPFVKDGTKRGKFYFRNLAGAYPGWDIYPEARRSWGQFERYQAADDSFRSGVAVRIGHSNYGDPEALSVLLDPNSTDQIEDAPLRENQQVMIGGVHVKCLREHHPNWGTRMMVWE